MRHLLIGCFLLFFLHSFAQNSPLPYTINWKNPIVSETVEDETVSFFHFQNAVYRDINTMFPYFSVTLPIANIAGGNENIEIILKNTKFQSLNKNTSGIKNIQKLPNTITIDAQIAYNRKKAFWQINFIPVIKNKFSGQIELLSSFDISYRPKTRQKTKNLKTKHTYAASSKLSTGTWVKIKTVSDGIYKMSFDELRSLGISVPQNVRLFGYGAGMLPLKNNEENFDDLVENSIYIENNHIYFYAQGANKWYYDETKEFYRHEQHLYSNSNYYFLTSDYQGGNANRVQSKEQAASAAAQNKTNFVDFAIHEKDIFNFLNSGTLWVGEKFDINRSQEFSFSFPTYSANNTVKAQLSLYAGASASSTFTVNAYDFSTTYSIPKITYSTNSALANNKTGIIEFTGNKNNDITINLTYNQPYASAESWLDFIEVNAVCELKLTTNFTEFWHYEKNAGTITNFSIKNTNSNSQVWDITDIRSIRKINATLNGSQLSFKIQTDSLHKFIVFNTQSANLLSPVTQGSDVGRVTNQNLHGSSQVDMIIVSHPDFLSYSKEIADLHRQQDNFSVIVATTTQVYNEFSSGMTDAGAIRNFVRMFYDRAKAEDEMPKYLLLFGDGSFDNKGNKSSDKKNTNFIPTFQSSGSLSKTNTFVIDDFYGLLDEHEGGQSSIDSDLLDIGIGRLPAKSTTEAANLTNKIKNYISPASYGDWRNTVCFIADDEDNNRHITDADKLAVSVKNNYPVFNIEKIYLDAFQQVTTSSGQRYPEAEKALNNRIKKGALIINYTGHANEEGWANEHILGINDINEWDNFNQLPIFMTATCEFSRYDDFEKTSGGELVLLNKNGGAIAMFSTTRLVYSHSNYTLNKNFYSYIFAKNDHNQSYRLGDIVRLTKTASGSSMNKRNFSLLGNPALKLAYPKDSIFTESITINDTTYTTSTSLKGTWSGEGAISHATPTLKALSKVTVTGFIQKASGTQFNDFNGTVYPTIYDKEYTITTLDNDGDGAFNFSIQNNIVYKGKATVKNGQFSFTFIVPKDIAYNIDYGKISYYAHAETSDALGVDQNLLVGDWENAANTDKTGPEIKLYLNDENFAFGGITNKSPIIYATVFDSSGINTIGNGIGHDITAILDDNTRNVYILNDSYEADKDSYQSGKIQYPLKDLETGEHSLKLKVWDVYNNSSETYTEFLVTESSELILEHIFNYPNPFTDKTAFYFQHNQPATSLDVLVQIYTVSGRLIKTIETTINSQGYRSPPIYWDGFDDYGHKIGRGAYIYRIKLRSPYGKTVEKYEKLVLLK